MEKVSKADIQKAVALIRNLHYFSGINEPKHNFCGKCGQYLTHEIHLGARETEQDAGERILCQLFQTGDPASEREQSSGQ